MAESLGRDVIVDESEWNTIMGQLRSVDTDLKDLLQDYLAVLEVLVNDGFVQGTQHDNMVTFRKAVLSIQTMLEDVYSDAESAIKDLKEQTAGADHNTSIFNLGR